MAITKTVVGKVRLSEKSLKVRSYYKDDDEALRAMGASGLRPQGFTLMHVEKHDGTGFGKVGATRKSLCHFGVKPWLIVCFHIVKGEKGWRLFTQTKESISRNCSECLTGYA